jgi:hypothetical protein
MVLMTRLEGLPHVRVPFEQILSERHETLLYKSSPYIRFELHTRRFISHYLVQTRNTTHLLSGQDPVQANFRPDGLFTSSFPPKLCCRTLLSRRHHAVKGRDNNKIVILIYSEASMEPTLCQKTHRE